MKTGTVGELSAGVLGIGIAQALAQTHHQVILVDIAPDILSRAEQLIRQNTRWMRMFDSKKRATDIDTVISRIPFTTDHERLHDMPIVIENVTEKWEIKKQMNAICGAPCPWPKRIREGINHE